MNVLDIILNFVVKICEPLSQYEYKSLEMYLEWNQYFSIISHSMV